MTRRLFPKPLSAAAFAPHGEVIAVGDGSSSYPINHGHSLRFDLAGLDFGGGSGRVSIFRSTPLESLVLHGMERHPRGSQMFMPLSANPYLVVVAGCGEFNPEKIEAFLAQGQGVVYRPGCWHHFSLALDQVSDFLVVDRAGGDKNCDEVALDPPVLIEVRR